MTEAYPHRFRFIMLRNRSICPSPRKVRLARAQVALGLPPPVVKAPGVGRRNSSGDRRDGEVETFERKKFPPSSFSHSESLY